MVKNIINLEEREHKILNIVKAKFGLKNKSEAVAFLLKHYEEKHLERGLKPDSSAQNAAPAEVEEHLHGHYIG